MVKEVTADELRWRCPDSWLPAESTADVEPSRGIIGQDRAVKALEFGLAVPSLGFNVFVTGLTGTGRMTAIELHIGPLAEKGQPPDDLVYTYNFSRPERPRLLRLRAGRGVVLRDGLERLLGEMRANLPGIFDGEDFQRRLEMALEDLKAKQQSCCVARAARPRGRLHVQVQVGS
jgi:hypothetical protein